MIASQPTPADHAIDSPARGHSRSSPHTPTISARSRPRPPAGRRTRDLLIGQARSLASQLARHGIRNTTSIAMRSVGPPPRDASWANRKCAASSRASAARVGELLRPDPSSGVVRISRRPQLGRGSHAPGSVVILARCHICCAGPCGACCSMSIHGRLAFRQPRQPGADLPSDSAPPWQATRPLS
jgi:hypothetical protein